MSHNPIFRFTVKRRFKIILLLATQAFTLHVNAAATFLTGCFPVKGDVKVTLNDELSSAMNYAGNTISPLNNYMIPAEPQPAQCSSCPGLRSTDKENMYSYRATPLMAGSTPGYGKLTDKLDIQLTLFTDTVAGGGTLTKLTTYPITAPPTSTFEGTNDESTQSLCAKSPAAGVPQRTFNWNKLTASIHIVQPIFGTELIPTQTLAETSLCIFYGTGSCSFANAQLASRMTISGSLSAPLSCTINAGSIINVGFNSVASSNFVAQGQPPVGFALRDVDINFHCDNPASDNTDKIKLTLTSDQGVSDTGTGYIAKMMGRDDIGVRMYDSNNLNVALDGSMEFPIKLDGNGDGHILMSAAPVATTSAQPAPGKFEGNVTVRMDIK
ncbi:fimbrial protein [Kluyvera cryocrescens]|uniref:fimbrial protein n=1 Tax=Kluyvera cryocrescens TaxID=580 RepID=UPI0039F4C5A5